MDLNHLPAKLKKRFPDVEFRIEHHGLCSELKAELLDSCFSHEEETLMVYIFSNDDIRDCANPYFDRVKKDPEKYATPFVKYQEYQDQITKEVRKLLMKLSAELTLQLEAARQSIRDSNTLYATACFEFYTTGQTSALILDEETMQGPTEWEQIHSAFCESLNKLHLEARSIDADLQTALFYEQQDEIINGVLSK